MNQDGISPDPPSAASQPEGNVPLVANGSVPETSPAVEPISPQVEPLATPTEPLAPADGLPVAAEAVAPPVEKPRRHAKGTLREYLESLLVTIILALFVTTFIIQAFKIPSPSMEGTLLVGDHLLVNKFVFGGRGNWLDRLLPYREIRPGDIIVFKFPFDDHAHYVKRVIGVPGDRVRILNHQVYLNGKALAEPYKAHDPNSYDPYGDNFPPTTRYFPQRNVRSEWSDRILNYVEKGELVVPPGKYFVMGDNRDHSWDSRYWGFVDRENIMGQPLLIYWSVEATTEDYADRTLNARLVGLTHTLANLPKKTRWNRMFRAVR